MSHPNETLLRDAYAAANRGDFDGFLRTCAPDFCFQIPGHSRLCGSYVGSEGIQQLAARIMAITGNTFQEDVEDVLANDLHGVVLIRHRFTREGRRYDYRTAHVYDFADGKLACGYEQPRDAATFEEAWGVAGYAS